MAYEAETEYSTAYYRCIDPIENLKIKVVVQPVKSLYIPLPQFDVTQSSTEISSDFEGKEVKKEEYTFKWQEKVLSKEEASKYSCESDWKKTISEKYPIIFTEKVHQDCLNKIFSYVEVDNYSVNDNNFEMFTKKNTNVTFLSKKINDLHLPRQNIKNYKNIRKRNAVNFHPSKEFKNQAHLPSVNIQRMFIMIDLTSETKENTNNEKLKHHEYILCRLIYDYSNNVLQMTPSFTKSKSKPYIIGLQNEGATKSYYYWLYHTSPNIPNENLTKEIQIMRKMFKHHEELRNLQIEKEFFIGKPDCAYITLLCEIVSSQGFEYDNLHIHYFIKLPSEWNYSDAELLMGRTQTSHKNYRGICHFSHLFEMNFCVELNVLEDFFAPLPELFFEALSVDNYNRCRNEGYTYVSIPKNPGMYNYTLKCWRLVDNSIMSKLKRFFIGGGVELEDVSCVGLSPSENESVMSRFGTETIPEGEIKIKLSVLQQSKIFSKKIVEPEADKRTTRLDSGSLLGSVNTVLEAFRRARERMLMAKKSLQADLNNAFPEDFQENGKK